MKEGKCAVCGKKAGYRIRHAGIGYCKTHFARYVEKKIKQGIRELGVFENRKIGILLGGDAGSSSVLNVMEGIAPEKGIGILKIKPEKDLRKLARKAKKNSAAIVLTGHSLEDFIIRMLVLCSEKKPKELAALNPKTGVWGKVSGISFPAPAFRLYREELELYARINGLSRAELPKREGLEKAISSFIEGTEKKHPGTKHKLLKSLLFLGGIKPKTTGTRTPRSARGT